MKTDRQARYRVFVMTFWLEDEGDLAEPETWRFRVEEPTSGIRRGCVGIQRLVALLCHEISDAEVIVKYEIESTTEGERQNDSNSFN